MKEECMHKHKMKTEKAAHFFVTLFNVQGLWITNFHIDERKIINSFDIFLDLYTIYRQYDYLSKMLRGSQFLPIYS